METKKIYLIALVLFFILLIQIALIVILKPGLPSVDSSKSSVIIPALRCIHLNSEGYPYEAVIAGATVTGNENKKGGNGIQLVQYKVMETTGIVRGGAEFDTRAVKSVHEATLTAQVQASSGHGVIVYPSMYPLTVRNETSMQTLWYVDSPVAAIIDTKTLPLYPHNPYTVTISLPPEAISPGGTTNLMFRLASEGIEPEDVLRGGGKDQVLLTGLKLIVR